MRYSMLVVDDAEINRDILQVLFHEQYDIIDASGGIEAMQVLEACQGNIDVILLDLMMPEMSGLELLKKIKEQKSTESIPVVVITASNSVEDQIEAFNLGAADFVTKPFVPEIVVSRVNNVVESTRRYAVLRTEKEKLKQRAQLDQMTSLLNKTTTEEMIMSELLHHPMRLHAFMIIDIDNFKSVNDNEGHLVGDHTIKIIANQIVSQFRSSDIIGRIGGDEFVVFMSNIPSKEIARKKANELAMLLKYKPNLTIPANVSVSIGIAFSDNAGFDYAEIFKAADSALYDAKKFGKARVCEYGQTYHDLEDDDRSAVLLFSRNRNVCSTVQAVYSMTHIVVEAMSFEHLSEMSDALKKKVDLSYIDISDESDEGVRVWNRLIEEEPWAIRVPSITICEEGNLNQFRTAMESGTSDILTVPLEIDALKRRTRRYLHSEESTIVTKESNFDGSEIKK